MPTQREIATPFLGWMNSLNCWAKLRCFRPLAPTLANGKLKWTTKVLPHGICLTSRTVQGHEDAVWIEKRPRDVPASHGRHASASEEKTCNCLSRQRQHFLTDGRRTSETQRKSAPPLDGYCSDYKIEESFLFRRDCILPWTRDCSQSSSSDAKGHGNDQNATVSNNRFIITVIYRFL